MSTIEYIFITSLLIIVLIIIIAIIYYINVGYKGQTDGNICDNDLIKCASGLFCSGAYTCQQAPPIKEGKTCDNSNQCEIGFTCASSSKTCQPSN